MNKINESENVVTFPFSWVLVETLIVFNQECCFLKLVYEGKNLFSLLIHQSRKLDYSRRLISIAES